MINSKQRAYLRGLANQLTPIFQVGKSGISEESCLQIGNALTARELIKLHILEACPYTPRQAADILAEELSADVVAVIGLKVVLYRQNTEKPKITLP